MSLSPTSLIGYCSKFQWKPPNSGHGDGRKVPKSSKFSFYILMIFRLSKLSLEMQLWAPQWCIDYCAILSDHVRIKMVIQETFSQNSEIWIAESWNSNISYDDFPFIKAFFGSRTLSTSMVSCDILKDFVRWSFKKLSSTSLIGHCSKFQSKPRNYS